MADTPAAAPVAAPASPAPAPAPAAPAPVITSPEGGGSLIDSAKVAPPAAAPAAAAPTPQMTLAEAQKIVEAARLAADPNSGAAWNWNDTTPGKGERPAWFKADKYKSVEAQAAAYPDLEKRFGAFTGAPKDGKYVIPQVEVDGKPVFQIKVGDDTIDVDPTHPILQEFNKVAAESQLSQQGYDKFLGLMAHYVASLEPDMAEQKAALGPNADARISAVAQWAQNNLDANGFQLFRTATSGENAAVNFALMEQLIAKTGDVKLPAPGQDVVQPKGVTRETIVEMQGKKNEKGQRLYEIDPAYRRTVDQAWQQYVTLNPVQRDRTGNVRV